MNSSAAASIVVSNCDYGRFLGDAIDSALEQTHPDTQVIVVDDGSRDDSREVIRGYGDRVTPVLKENGGQASALNAGYQVSDGDVVVFLDADDALLPSAVGDALAVFSDPDVVKVQWPLWVIDAHGRRTGELKAPELPEGDMREAVLRRGPASALPSAPTSGNAWSRGFLDRVMPIPEEGFRICSDAYLFSLAPALGSIGRLPEPHGLFRMHGDNGYQARPFEDKLALGARQEREQFEALRRVLASTGAEADVAAWRESSWWQRLERAVDELVAAVPAGETFALADEDNWGVGDTLMGRRRLPFPERDGRYAGPPADGRAAVAELERVRRAGARFAVFGWPAFWWLEYYEELSVQLHSCGEPLVRTERVIVFALDCGES